jgi:predicted AlkP superfamily phosphohydrolase/phosphomutase
MTTAALYRRTALSLLAVAVLAAPAAAASSPRVVILGFDGADAKLTAQWMNEGKLPNLAKLRDEGTFAPLRSTVPSQTPVSWSTFSTGLQPGRHAIFDFLKRDIATYRPSFAAFDEGKAPFLWGERNPLYIGGMAALALGVVLLLVLRLLRVSARTAALVAVVAAVAAGVAGHAAAAKLLPTERPLAINRQQGDTFWEILGKAGKRVRVMRMPVTFPPEPFDNGELLSGLGVPDTSGRIGKPFYFTSELFYQPRGGGEFKTEIVELIDNKGVIPTEIKGPPDKLFSPPGQLNYISIPMTLTVPDSKKSLALEVSGQKLTLAPGEWSDWVRFVFPFNRLIKVHGIGRFRLISVEPEVRLYLSSIQFDPENLPPILEITSPEDFVHTLTSRFGLFKTSGWTTDTWGIADGTADEQIFMEDVTATRIKEEEMLQGLLADDWDVYFHYFEFTDRVQHILWRFTDPKHPSYTAAGAAQWGGKILEAYQQMDAIVGKVRAGLPQNGVLFVASDHGFASWRRTMNYNTWLFENGYLVFKGQRAEKADLQDLFDQTGEFFQNVDWSRSRAYAMGLGNIYVNLKGREAQGIVEPGAEYEALRDEIRLKLEAFVDAETGEHPVAHVFTRDEAYGTYDPVVIPDMFPSNSEGYRVGWQDALGIVAQQVIQTNTGAWSGDHCSVYPPLVDGILFSTLKLAHTDTAFMGDVMPTLLALYGVQAPVKLDGKSLLP